MYNKIGIVGAGAMGSGIAQVAAIHGCDVVLCDTQQGALTRAIGQIEKVLVKLADKEVIAKEDIVGIIGRIHCSTQLSALKECDLVIEAIVEDIEVKHSVFDDIESVLGPESVLASNTSSLSITEMAVKRSQPQRFLGVHFFNPPGLMRLVEVVPTTFTSQTVIDKVIMTINRWDKIAVLAQDSPGFIVNKVARTYYSEAIKILEEGTADVHTIDAAMIAKGFKMGPFALMDYIGHDVNYAVTESVWKSFFYDDRYMPSFTQKRLVQAGFLGRKSNKGFYDYGENAAIVSANQDQGLQEYISNRIICMLINEAADTVARGICNEADVELASRYGVNYPKGLLAWAEELGIDHVVSTLDMLYHRYHESRYRVSVYLRDRASIYSQRPDHLS